MVKLKALRGSIGSYGRVTAGGIVEVDETKAEKLVKSKRFVRASAADIEAAEKAQKAYLQIARDGAGPTFAPMPDTPQPAEDEFAALELTEQRAHIEAATAELMAEAQRLETLAATLDLRQVQLEEAEADLKARTEALDADVEQARAHAEDLGQREGQLATRLAAAEEAETARVKAAEDANASKQDEGAAPQAAGKSKNKPADA